MSYRKGERVGDYEIVDVLGAGGMGQVYQVRNVISQRVEAMKVLLPNLEADPDLADRFMREIRVQASLQHPNIAALHTALHLNNQLVMLIEYVEGTTLDRELRNGPIPVGKALAWIRQVLLALGYAHARGVIHRDIKPANVMLTPSGTVKLMDFGIARLAADRKLTQTGRTVGSLYYMSPEQIQGAEDLDARSDLYSLGVTLYEMVTARRPFQGDSDYSIMAAHLSAHPVPPVELDPALPRAVSDLILKAIAKDPGARFQTAEEFRAAVDRVLQASVPAAASGTKLVVPPPPESPRPSSRRGLYMALGSVVTVAVLALAALQGPKLFAPGEAAGAAPQPPAQTTPPPPSNPSPSIEAAPQVPNEVPKQVPKQVPTGPPAAGVSRQVSPPDQSVPNETPAPAAGAAQPPAPLPEPTVPVQAAPTPTQTAATSEELQGARETLMLLGTRANAVKASLTSLKEQQARIGTSLRGDIVTAEQRMEFYLDEAQAAISAGNAAKAKTSLAAAERALETVEKFLGR